MVCRAADPDPQYVLSSSLQGCGSGSAVGVVCRVADPDPQYGTLACRVADPDPQAQ